MPNKPEKTTFSFDVLGNYICTTWEDATKNSDGIDVIVIGSGMYGGYCASEIYQQSLSRFGKTNKLEALRVLVLEAGPFLVPEHAQNIPNFDLYDPGIFPKPNPILDGGPIDISSGADVPTRKLVWGVGWRSNQPFVGQAYCVGGKGIYWGGWCPRLQDSDLAQWPKEVKEYLLTQNVSKRPISDVDPITETPLNRDESIAAYETLEYEIGVKPGDDFIFDPMAITTEESDKVGLNKALRVFLESKINDINTEIQANDSQRKVTQIIPAPIAVQTEAFIPGTFSLDKYSSLPALVGSIRNDHGDGRSDNLRISVVPFAHVSKLNCQPDSESPKIGTRIINKITVNVNGEEKTLQIKPHCQVVLAMGCIDSTRLALESFSLVDSLIRLPGDELMGRNFMFHLRCDIAFDIERARLADFVANNSTLFINNSINLNSNKSLAELLQLACLHIQCEGQYGRYQYQLFAATNDDGPDDNMYEMIPDIDVQREIAQEFQSDKIRFVLRASGEVLGGRHKKIGDPNFDYVNLAGKDDFDLEFNHQRAWVQFNRGNHSNDKIWKDIHDTGHTIAKTLANGGNLNYREDAVNGVASFGLGDLKVQQGVGTTFHDAGTLWMGDDPNSSVTDVNGHFHHVTNAYCCDQAIFTTVGSANPVLTGLCVSRKVAEDIVNRFDGHNTTLNTNNFTFVSFAESRGWLQAPRNGGINVVSNDLIETTPSEIGFYYLPEVYSDFELFVEWKAFRSYSLEPNQKDIMPNSGILLRMPNPKDFNFDSESEFDNFYNKTIEIQIDETGKDFSRNAQQLGRPPAIFGNSKYKTGSIYGVSPATQWAAKVVAPEGDTTNRYWNLYHIIAKGRKVIVSLNGKKVSESTLPPEKLNEGFIGFQFHTGKVWFRNLWLKS
ncbi:MAG: family 16 glycoside hydrolase [Cyanobacteria bacterium P01_G01_bin.39]